MTTKRFFFVLTGFFTLLVLLIGGSVYFGNTVIQKQSKKLADLKAQNQAVEDQKVSLSQAKRDIEKYSELNDLAKAIVPQDKDQAKTVREIDKIARESGIALKAITFQTSNLGQATTSQKPASDSATTPSTSVPVLTQVTPVEGIKGVYSFEIVISPVRNVSYRSFLSFLERLESNRRTAHVTKINISPSEDGQTLNFTLTLSAYVKP